MHYGWRLARLGFLFAGILTCSASYALEGQPGSTPAQAAPQTPYSQTQYGQPGPLNPNVLTPGTRPAAPQSSGPQLTAPQPTVVISSATRPVLETFNGLPAVLSSKDAQLYREIFALQHKGKWKTADKLIKQLENRRLMGHVLYQRYMHPTAYRSKYKELKAWMDSYADHPGASTIYKLALKRRPKNYKYPRRPENPSARLVTTQPRLSYNYKSSEKRTRGERRRVAKYKRQIRRDVLRTRLTKTERFLETKDVRRLFDQVEIDEGYGKVAAAWFYYGKPKKAFQLADRSARRSGQQIPIVHWTAGLAAWRLGRIEDAAYHFGSLAASNRASPWNVAAGAYWAARAHLKLQNPSEMSRWLRVASAHPRTFYGLLGRRALGMKIEFAFHQHVFKQEMVDRIEADPAGSRALALLQVGQRNLAQKELVRVAGWGDSNMAEALLVVAERGGMPHLAFRIGNRLAFQQTAQHGANLNSSLDAALYPIPPWQPKNGFKVDRALIYALMRQESNFNPQAKSPDGARGLMQLMPRTASYVSPRERYRGRKRNKLFEPGLNMELGQRYVAYLLRHTRVQGDLFRLTTAYNGGPGNLGKWERRVNAMDDPLLFIESLPSRETRLFIERVLSNLWIYRHRLGQPAPSLERLAAGGWPQYQALDRARAEVALNVQN